MRAELAKKISGVYARDAFVWNERALAEDIFRLLMNDAEIMVRKTLAEVLCHTVYLPSDIAMQLARDVEEVALPMLRHSFALLEEDMVMLVRNSGSVAIVEALASRESLSEALSTEIVNKALVNADAILLDNKGAAIGENSLHKLISVYRRDQCMLEKMVARGQLPIRVVERLFLLVSEALQKHLIAAYHLPQRLITQMTEQAREHAMLEMLPGDSPDEAVEGMVQELLGQAKLTPSLVMRALCTGDLRFFQMAIAALSGVPLLNTKILLMDPGQRGFKALYEASGLPQSLYEDIRSLHQAAMEETRQGRFKRQDYQKRVAQRLASGAGEAAEQLPYMLSILGSTHDASFIH